MARITISELSFSSSKLLQDSKSFFNELSDREMDVVIGGKKVDTLVIVNQDNYQGDNNFNNQQYKSKFKVKNIYYIYY
jgi:hypothetical protein